MVKKFCRSSSSENERGGPQILRKMTIAQFMDRAVKRFPHFFHPLGIRHEANKEVEETQEMIL